MPEEDKGKRLDDYIKLPSLILSPEKEKAAQLLAEGHRQAVVAKTIGYDRATIWKWSKDPVFRKRIESLRIDIMEEANEVLQETTTKAAQAISGIATGEIDGQGIASQLKAAMYILQRVEAKPLPTSVNSSKDIIAPVESYTDDEVEELMERGSGKRAD